MKKHKENIIKEVTDSIRSCLNPQMSIPNIIRYLLGEKNELKEISDSAAYKIYNHASRSLSPEHAYLFANSTNWTPERIQLQTKKSINIDATDLEKVVSPIFNKYFSEANCNISQMIKYLISLHFFNTKDCSNLFGYKKIVPCNNYVLWEEKYQEMQDSLTRTNILFVTGKPGSGKLQLVKYYIANNSDKFLDIGWVEGNYITLEQCLENIPFIAYKDSPLIEKAKKMLSEKSENSLLVIVLPVFTNADFSLLKDVIRSIKLNIIIITRTQISARSTEYPTLSLNDWPNKLLKQIFINTYKADFFTEEEYNIFFKITDKSPLIIVLIGKGLQKYDKSSENIQTISEAPNFSKDDLLDEKEWIWNNEATPEINKQDYIHSTSSYNILSHIRYTLTKYNDTKYLMNTGVRLSLCAKSEVSYNYLELYFSTKELATALGMGLLEYCNDEKTIVKMPAIVSDAIWSEYPIPFTKYKNTITEYLESIDDNSLNFVCHRMKYSIISNIIYRFHFEVITLKSSDGKNKPSDLKNWFNLLIHVVQKLIELGNVRVAYDITTLLYVTRSKSREEYPIASSFELSLKNLLKQFNYFIANPGQIDKLIECNKIFLKEISAANSTDYISIPLFILNQIHFYMIRTEHINDIDIIISHKNFILNDTIFKIYSSLQSNEKLYKYQSCLYNKNMLSVESAYFELVTLYIQVLYPKSVEKQSTYLQRARKLLHNIIDQSSFSDSWNYKTLLDGIFYECIICILTYSNPAFPLHRLGKSFLNNCIEKMNVYFHDFSSHWDISWLYSINIILYNSLPFQTKTTHEYWDSVFNIFSYIANEQIILSDDYKNRTLEAINTAKEKIHKISD